MTDRDETNLLDAARAGDADALEALLARYQSRIYRFSMKMCRDPEDARDVLQDTLLAMARGLGDFRGESAISTWLYTIARSHCIKKRRRSKFAPAEHVSLEAGEAPEAHEVPDPGRRPDEQVADRQIEAALEKAIGALDPAYRDVLLLRDVEGLPAAEVAQVMSLSVPAVKSRLHRARAAVRESLAPVLGPPAAAPAAGARCPDIVRLFSRHLEGEISPRACEEMERHLARCGRCRQACDSLKRVLGLCRASAPPAVPEEVQRTVREGIRGFLAGRA